MSVYFQFKSSTVKESIPINCPFITVGELRLNILEKKILRRNRRSSDSDIILSNYETKEDYVDDGTLIPKHATVWVRRVPVQPFEPIITIPPPLPVAPDVVPIDPEDLEWEELVKVINGTAVKSGKTIKTLSSQNSGPEMDEDSKIKALVEKPALDWQNGPAGFARETPHPGYVCHKCKIPGHFIKHCPTNGDPEYNHFKRAAVLKPNEAAFEKAMEGVPSTSSRSVGHQLPPELHCRICKQVMKDAVLTGRCCFDSFCDRCIRNHIITKFSCVCGAKNVLADDLIPNLTLRGTINRILESSSNSSSSGESVKHESVSVKESAPAASQDSDPLPDVEVEKKPVSDKTAEKKGMPLVTPYEDYMMYMGYNPYWGAMQPVAYNTGYGYGPYGFVPMSMPFGVEQNMMMNSGFNAQEVRRANEKRKRDDHREHSCWSRNHNHHHSESTEIASSAKAEKEEGALKKRKLSSSSKGYHESRTTSVSSRKSVANDETSDDDERHFKRRASWYKSSPPATMKREEERERAMKHGRWERSRSRDGRFPLGDRIGGRAIVA